MWNLSKKPSQTVDRKVPEATEESNLCRNPLSKHLLAHLTKLCVLGVAWTHGQTPHIAVDAAKPVSEKNLAKVELVCVLPLTNHAERSASTPIQTTNIAVDAAKPVRRIKSVSLVRVFSKMWQIAKFPI